MKSISIVLLIALSMFIETDSSSIKQQLPFGVIDDSYNVSNAGSYNHIIPIHVPPGINGLIPNIALSYDSRGGLSSIGYGWDITGISKISRTGNSFIQHGRTSGIDFTTNDGFVLNGQFLTVIRGINGKDGTEYRTENESFAVIIAKGQAVTNKSSSSPEYFYVKQANGLTYYYGDYDRKSADSRLDFKLSEDSVESYEWYVSKIQDPLGNYIKFSYEQHKNSIRISSISYTGNESRRQVPQNEIKFNYESDQSLCRKANISYLKGVEIYDNNTLNNIEVKIKEQPLKYYHFEYNSSKTYLERLIESADEKKEISLKPTKILWNSIDSLNFSGNQIRTTLKHYKSTGERLSQVVDLNNDGIEDYLVLSKGKHQDGRDATLMTIYNYSTSDTSNLKNKILGDWFENVTGKKNFDLVDFDGDGKADVVTENKVWLNTSNATSFSFAEVTIAANCTACKNFITVTSGNGNVNNRRLSFDWNGDGKAEYILFNSTNGKAKIITLNEKLELSATEFDAPFSELSLVTTDGVSSKIALLSYNSNVSNILSYGKDGRISSAVLYLPTSNGFQFTNTTSLRFKDINSDGVDDIIVEALGQPIKFWLGNGTTDFRAAKFSQTPFNYNSTNNASKYEYGHYTRTDLTQLIRIENNLLELYDVSVDPASGLSLTKNESGLRINIPDKSDLTKTGNFSNWYFTELNGDGLLDIEYSDYPVADGGMVVRRYTNESRFADKVKSIEDGFGNIVNVTFSTIKDESVYGVTTNVLPKNSIRMNGLYNVVKYVTFSNGVTKDSLNRTSFNYTDLCFDTRGRGLLGFREFLKTESSTGITTISEYELQFPLTGRLKSERKRTSNGTFFYSQYNTWQSYQYENGSLLPRDKEKNLDEINRFNTTKISYLPILKMSTVIKKELNDVETSNSTVTYNYNSFGQIERLTTALGNGSFIVSEKKFKQLVTGKLPQNVYVLGLVAEEKSYGMKGSTYTDSRTIMNEYDSQNGKLIKSYRQKGEAQYEQVTSYGYDRFGNLVKKTIQEGKPEEIKEEYKYDLDNTFLVNKKIYLSAANVFEQSFEYEPLYGYVTKDKDANGLETNYQYDIFGNVVEVKRSNGTKTSYAYEFIKGSDDPFFDSTHNALYRIIVQNSGMKPETKYFDQLGKEVGSITYLIDTGATQTVQGRGNLAGESREKVVQRAVVDVHEYDNRGNIIREYKPQYVQHINDWVLDKLGSSYLWRNNVCIQLEDSQKFVNKLFYDEFNRLVKTEFPDGKYCAMQYVGKRKIEINTEGRTKTTTYTSTGQIESVLDDQKHEIGYAYDLWGNLISITQPNGLKSTITYDKLGRKTKLQDPDLGTIATEYDNLDRPIKETTNGVKVVSTKYDCLNRVVQKITDEGVATWTYDQGLKGLIYSYKDANGNVKSFEYDQLARLSKEIYTIDDDQYAIRFSYNSNGQLLTKKYPNEYTIRYNYINAIPVGVSELRSDGTEKKLANVTSLLANGKVSVKEFGNGTTSSYSYDKATDMLIALKTVRSGLRITPPYKSCPNNNPAFSNPELILGQLLREKEFAPRRLNPTPSPPTPILFESASDRRYFDELSENTIQDYEYSYNSGYNIVQKADRRRKEVSAFDYDNLNRLTTANLTAGGTSRQLSISYSANGNILDKSDVGTYSYENNQLKYIYRDGKAVHQYSYDGFGNITGDIKSNLSIAYTSFNKPSKISKGNRTINFEYGVYNEETYREEVTGNRVTQSTTRPFSDYEIIEQNNEITNVVMIYLGDDLIAIHRTNQGEAIAATDSYVHKDHLGSIDVLTNGIGTIETEYSYDVFGKRSVLNGSNRSLVKGFTGFSHFDDFGIVNANGRFYFPMIGRFVTADPFVQVPTNLQNLNRYSFALNNPVNVIDPSGYFFKKIFRAIGGAVKAVVKAVVNVGRAVVNTIKDVAEAYVELHVKIFEEAERFASKYGKQILIIAAAAAITYFSGGTLAGFGMAMLNGAILGASIGASVAAIGGGSIQDILNAGFSGAITGAAAGAMGYGLASGAKALFDGASYGNAVLGAARGYMASGKEDGIYKGILASFVPADLGIGNVADENSHWNMLGNLVISSGAAAAQGYIMDGEHGMREQMLGNSLNFAVGHSVAAFQSGRLPNYYKNGAAVYEKLDNKGASFSVGGAILLRSRHHTDHEFKHFSEQNILGPYYLPGHGISQGSQTNFLERPPFLNDDLYEREGQ